MCQALYAHTYVTGKPYTHVISCFYRILTLITALSKLHYLAIASILWEPYTYIYIHYASCCEVPLYLIVAIMYVAYTLNYHAALVMWLWASEKYESKSLW